MSSNLDRIARVDISLDTPISNDANFDNILIVGPAPRNPNSDTAVPEVGVYSTLNEITELGFHAFGDGADPVGVAARVAFSQSPRPNEVYVAVYSDEGESSVAALLDNALEAGGWYCVCPVGLTDEEVLQVIQWTETQNKLCGYVEDDFNAPIVDAGLYFRSYAVYSKVTEDQLYNDIPAENKYGMAVAMAVKAMHYHSGEETWALKPLAAITPSKLTATSINTMNMNNISFVTVMASKNVTLGGKTNAGEWIDIIRFRDWLQNDMQVRVVNLLVVNPKIPYTDNGIALVENQMLASLKDGQKYGGIAPTEYDADGNPNFGYLTSVPRAAEITGTQKASRVLEDCKFSARLAGAIHLVKITGSLHYESL